MSAQPSLVNVEALRTYLAAHLPGDDGPVMVERIRGGHSNETFYAQRGFEQWVLRRPPRGSLLPTAHDVAREYRVLSALSQTNLPVPRTILLCDDSSILGAPFYLMERVHGHILRSTLPSPYNTDESSRYAIGIELVDRLANLHAVDWEAIGLAGFG